MRPHVKMQLSWNILMCSFEIYGKWSVQASKHIHMHAQCSHTSVGAHQAHLYNIQQPSWWCACMHEMEFTSPNGTVASSIYLLPPATTLPQLKKLQSTCIIILRAHVFRVHVCPGFTVSKSLNIWVCLWGWGWGGGTLLLGKATIKHRFHLHLTGRQTDQLTDSF